MKKAGKKGCGIGRMQKQCRRARIEKKSCREMEGCGKKVMQKTVERYKVTESSAKMEAEKKHKQKHKRQPTHANTMAKGKRC